MEGATHGDDLLPGALCTQSGIYQVIHRVHRLTHKVLVRTGDMFPRCNGCGAGVRFRLVKQVNQPAATRAKRVRKKSAGR